jgi:5-methylcytosine-specific restriction endonuclease McrA
MENLKVLCKKCHSEEPNHGHYKASLKKQGIL